MASWTGPEDQEAAKQPPPPDVITRALRRLVPGLRDPEGDLPDGPCVTYRNETGGPVAAVTREPEAQ